MTQFGFPKAYKLRSKKEIETLFTQGNASFYFPLKIVWMSYPEYNALSPVQVAISVSKKRFKQAVVRNLIKRRIRESMRMIFPEIQLQLQKQNMSLVCVIVYVDSIVQPYQNIFQHVTHAFQQIIPLRENS